MSGSGKSTIAKMVARIYDPLSGSVLVDGRDIRDFSVKSLRSKMAYVGQEPVLFASSIRDNMLLAKPDATEE